MLQILYVDDEEVLLDVGKEFLEESGELSVDTYESVAKARKGMEEREYDAIISDYQMPGCDGICFLKELRSQGNKIPFILFTGRGREEIVIEALNSGANFYLQKGGEPKAQFAELVHKLRTAVDRRAAEQKLITTNLELEKALEVGYLGNWTLDLETSEFSVNDRIWALHGTSAADEGGYQITLKHYIMAKVHPEDVNHFSREMMRIMETGSKTDSGSLEYRIIRPDGSARQIFVNYGLVRDEKGEPYEVHGVMEDITDRNESKARLGRLNRELMAIKEINKVIVRAKAEGELLDDICRLVCEVAGYSLAWIGLARADEASSLRPDAWWSAIPMYFGAMQVAWEETQGTTGPNAAAAASGAKVVIPDWDQEDRFPSWREASLRAGFRSSIAIPLMDPASEQPRAIGVLMIYSVERSAFRPQEVELLEEMVNDLAYGVVSLRAQAERRQAEAALRESEGRFRSLADTAFDGVVVSIDGIIVDVNRKFCELFGYPRHELVGKKAIDLFAPDSKEILLAEQKRETPHSYVANVLRKDGNVLTIEVNGKNWEWKGGRARVATVQDITERRQAERALRLSEQRFDQLAEQGRTIVWEMDANGLYTFVSRMVGPVLGYRPDEIEGKMHFYDLHPPEGRDEFRSQGLVIIASQEKFVNLYNPMMAKDGRTIWASSNGFPLRDERGLLLGYRGSDTDISEQKAAEDRLSESEDKYRSIFQAERDSVFLLDVETGAILEANEAACGMFSFSLGELIGMQITDLSAEPERTRKALQERLERIPLRYYRRKDGTVFPADISISHFTLRGRRMQTVVMRDIDKNVRAEHQMQERIKELQAFYSLARISSDDSLGLEGKYQEIAEMLPASWQYPEIAVARVSVNGRHYDSNGFRSSLWVQSAPIMVHGEQVGMVEVGYLEERPTSEEGPFMKEERLLIDAVAERLGRISERHTAQARLKEIERRK